MIELNSAAARSVDVRIQKAPPSGHPVGMKWQVIRLELASSGEFPRGSAGRSYIIRLPLNDDGAIDTAMLESQPSRATVRRYWPNQADMLGYLVTTPDGYAIRYEMKGSRRTSHADANGSHASPLFQFAAAAIRIGEEISLTEPDGHSMRFRVAGMQ